MMNLFGIEMSVIEGSRGIHYSTHSNKMTPPSYPSHPHHRHLHLHGDKAKDARRVAIQLIRRGGVYCGFCSLL